MQACRTGPGFFTVNIIPQKVKIKRKDDRNAGWSIFLVNSSARIVKKSTFLCICHTKYQKNIRKYMAKNYSWEWKK
ncbi:hypothetical protein B5F07_05245 [Lachnoclostridium sp. An169]|nr:hypothetical protein B5F07_05245 [Lachnoclostridium sp. An169]